MNPPQQKSFNIKQTSPYDYHNINSQLTDP